MAKGVGADDAETVKWYHRAAEHGVAYAQSRLGIMYEEGRGGLAQDYAEAVKWYRKAGEQGHAHALYEHGEKGVALDYAEFCALVPKGGPIRAMQLLSGALARLTSMATASRRTTLSPICGLTWRQRRVMEMLRKSATTWLNI